jgi:beta-lactam-binding protein with PASTA domain
VPNVEGLSESGATTKIHNAQLTVRLLTQPDAAPKGIVLVQSPRPGEMISVGGEVTIVISEGETQEFPTATRTP